ncbi:hypothetical protein D3C81_832570 [compost metagenome]
MNARPRRQAVALQGRPRDDQQGTGSIAGLARHRRRHPVTTKQVFQLGHLRQAGVARRLVMLDPRQRDDLALEVTVLNGTQGPLVRFQRVGLKFAAAQVPVLGNHLRCAELGRWLRAVTPHPALGAAKRVLKTQGSGGGHGRGNRDLGHGLHAPGDHHVLGAAHHRLRSKVHGLLGRTALAVDGGTGDLLGEPGSQPAGAGDVAGQRADGVDATENHVVVVVFGDAVTLDQRTQHMGAQVGGVNLAQAALAPPGGRAQGVDDIGFRHGLPQQDRIRMCCRRQSPGQCRIARRVPAPCAGHGRPSICPGPRHAS